MCGIAGVIYKQLGSLNSEFMRSLLNTMRHRGPDGMGWFSFNGKESCQSSTVESLSAVKTVLFHQRLAIIDLSEHGAQPFVSLDGRYVITFNGEIYNYLELKAELETFGYQFSTQTDTEVLLNVYIHWGTDGLKKCEGMFAFAILDTQLKKLVLARDFFGIKPLYYTLSNGNFIFASEIKTLLVFPEIERVANPQRAYDYLRFGLTDHGSETMLKGIYQLLPAHYMEVSLDNPTGLSIKRYWEISQSENLNLNFQDASERLRELFLDSINKHLRSDVPVGAALSGGIDSSAIVMSIRHLNPNADLRVFSYIAEDKRLSEEKWIDLIARESGAKSGKVFPKADELVRDLDDLIHIQDEPFSSTSIYAQYRVFKSASEMGVKVMLDGQGADEMLGGYHYFLSGFAVSLLRQRRLLDLVQFARSANKLPGMSLKQLGLGAMDVILGPAAQKYVRRWANKDLVPSWLNMDWFASHEIKLPALRHSKHKYVLREELRKNVTERGLMHLLRYEDRNSMAFSIESRVPFLVPQIADFLFSLPESHIISLQADTKAVFRRAMYGTVPNAILERRDKIGFQTPEKDWLYTIKPFVEDVLDNVDPSMLDILPINVVSAKTEWSQMLAGKKQFDSRFWRYVNLIRWSQLKQITFE